MSNTKSDRIAAAALALNDELISCTRSDIDKARGALELILYRTTPGGVVPDDNWHAARAVERALTYRRFNLPKEVS